MSTKLLKPGLIIMAGMVLGGCALLQGKQAASTTTPSGAGQTSVVVQPSASPTENTDGALNDDQFNQMIQGSSQTDIDQESAKIDADLKAAEKDFQQ